MNKVREVFKAMTNNCEMLKPQWPSKDPIVNSMAMFLLGL